MMKVIIGDCDNDDKGDKIMSNIVVLFWDSEILLERNMSKLFNTYKYEPEKMYKLINKELVRCWGREQKLFWQLKTVIQPKRETIFLLLLSFFNY